MHPNPNPLPTPEQIAEGRAMVERATALPWRSFVVRTQIGEHIGHAIRANGRTVVVADGLFPEQGADAALIVAAVNSYLPYLDLCERVRALEEALKPFADACLDLEAAAMFGGLGSPEAGVWYPDSARFAVVHVSEENEAGEQTATFAGSDDDIGQYTMGDLRRARAALTQENDRG